MAFPVEGTGTITGARAQSFSLRNPFPATWKWRNWHPFNGLGSQPGLCRMPWLVPRARGKSGSRSLLRQPLLQALPCLSVIREMRPSRSSPRRARRAVAAVGAPLGALRDGATTRRTSVLSILLEDFRHGVWVCWTPLAGWLKAGDEPAFVAHARQTLPSDWLQKTFRQQKCFLGKLRRSHFGGKVSVAGSPLLQAGWALG